jgi:hypothetical protein
MMTAAAGNFNKFRVSDSAGRVYRTRAANRCRLCRRRSRFCQSAVPPAGGNWPGADVPDLLHGAEYRA